MSTPTPGRTPSSDYALTLDAYEAANLLHVLATHKCLDSGDWYMQVRERLRLLTWDNVTSPNPLYCQNYGHDKSAPARTPSGDTDA